MPSPLAVPRTQTQPATRAFYLDVEILPREQGERVDVPEAYDGEVPAVERRHLGLPQPLGQGQDARVD